MTNISHCTSLTAEEALASKAVTVVSAALCFLPDIFRVAQKKQSHLGPSQGAIGKNPEAPQKKQQIADFDALGRMSVSTMAGEGSNIKGDGLIRTRRW